MSLQFLLGPAGYGKTTYVYDHIISQSKANPSLNYLLIVPDQFTMQTQLDIVKRHPDGGIMNIDVLSFGRLSYRIFEECGEPSGILLDDSGKNLVIMHVASKVKDRMPYLGKYLNKYGMIEEVKSCISEFMQYSMSVKDVEKLSNDTSDNLLQVKLKDLAVIYDEFNKYNQGKFITNEETLDALCSKIDSSEIIRNSVVVFDGFTGFTPIQERVIGKIMQKAKEVNITLDFSGPENFNVYGEEEKLFYLSRRTAHRLETLAKDLGVECKPYIEINDLNKSRFSNRHMLGHLEKNLFRQPFSKSDLNNGEIEIFSANTVSDEVDEIALRIYDLVRSGKYAYKDIAVVCGDLETYADSLEERLSEIGVPVFVDRTNKIVLNPFIEFIKSALGVLMHDFSYDSVFHLCRSGFTDFTSDEVDRLDLYVRSLNIRGKRAYTKEFTRIQRGFKNKDQALLEMPNRNETRAKLVDLLEPLLRPAHTAGDYVRNLYDFIKKNNSYERILKLKEGFETAGDLSRAREYSQIYDLVMKLLESIYALVGDAETTSEEFYRLFEAGVSEMKVGTIPGSIDRLLIGDLERTRLREVKVLLLAGLSDKYVPKRPQKGGIISDVERETMSKYGAVLAPTAREEMYTQRLYFYMNLCKPSERLILSFSGLDNEGNAAKPSYIINTILNMFTNAAITPIDTKPAAERIVSLKDSLKMYAKLVRNFADGCASSQEEALTKALTALYKDKQEEENANDIKNAAFYEYISNPLSRDIVKAIYGEAIAGSVSRLETYAGCAYAHFLQYGMKLDDAKDFSFSSMDLGTVTHAILDIYSSMLEARGLDWLSVSEAERDNIINDAVDQYCVDYEQGMLTDDDRSAYITEKIRTLMKRTIITLTYQLSQGKFKPLRHEYEFKREIKLSDEAKMLLTGKIDRIDLYSEGDKVFVKIIDYKTGNKELDVSQVYYGLEEQLAVYMSEAIKLESSRHPDSKVVPSAMLYYRLANPLIDVKGNKTPEDIETEIYKALVPKGLVDSDDENIRAYMGENTPIENVLPLSFEKDGTVKDNKATVSTEEMAGMLDYVDRTMKQIGKNIYSGNISISPISVGKKDSCEYCAYKSICRFDERNVGMVKRTDQDIDKETIEKTVFGGENGGGQDYIFPGSAGNN